MTAQGGAAQPPRPRRPRRFQRSIRFYRIFTRHIGDAIDAIASSTIPTLLAGIAERADRYVELDDGKGLECEPIPGHLDCMRMYRVRWQDRPQRYTVEQGSQDLELAENEGLSEAAHIRFFDRNILAAEVTRDGPAPTALRDFLRARFHERFGTFKMARIADAQAMERLGRIQSFKSAKIRLSEHSLQSLPEVEQDFWNPLTAFGRFGGEPGVFEFGWKVFRKNGRLNANAIRALVMYLIENEGSLDSASQIEIEGSDEAGNAATFIFQRDYLAAEETIARGQNGRVDSSDAFLVLGNAYNAVLNRIPRQDFIVEQAGQ